MLLVICSFFICCSWHAEGLKVIIVSCIVFSLSVTVALVITIYYGPPQVNNLFEIAVVVCNFLTMLTFGETHTSHQSGNCLFGCLGNQTK